MKKLLSIFFFSLCNYSLAQTRFAVQINHNGEDPNFVYLYRSYYNSLRIVAENIPAERLQLKGDSRLKIIKDSNNVFHVRIIGELGNVTILKLLDGNRVIDDFGAFIAEKIPYPLLHFYRGAEGGHFTGYSRKFDSLKLSHVFSDFSESRIVCNYTYNNEYVFKITSFEVNIISTGDTIFHEKTIGYKYSKKFIEFIQQKYHYPIPRLWNTDYLLLKNVTIKDDLGNEYVMPEKKLWLQ